MSPPRIDFYLLSDEQADAHWQVACRLLEKAYFKGHRVFVFCNNQEDAQLIDELLWTFKNDSFIPHNLQGEGPEPPPPIQIGWTGEPRGFNDILLNMASDIPTFYTRFRRVMEIVPSDESQKEQSRNHYKEYRTGGCTLNIHNL